MRVGYTSMGACIFAKLGAEALVREQHRGQSGAERGGRSTAMKSRICSAHAGNSSGLQASPGIARASAAGILAATYSAMYSAPFRS